MSRRALLIGGPGTPGQDGHLPGVTIDVHNYQQYLLSPLGGAWSAGEITTLINPDLATVTIWLKLLPLADYSFVLFGGHGHNATRTSATTVQLRPGVEISVDDLSRGASKHTLLVDCCRQVIREVRLDAKVAKSMTPMHALDPARCRAAFDREVQACAPGLFRMFGCSVGETANESDTSGGDYSSALLASARNWESSLGSIQAGVSSFGHSVFQAHTSAATFVKAKSAGKQNPTAEYPRVQKHFPFAVVA